MFLSFALFIEAMFLLILVCVKNCLKQEEKKKKQHSVCWDPGGTPLKLQMLNVA